MREIIDTATAAFSRALPATASGWLTLAAACLALTVLAAMLWKSVRSVILARARKLYGRFSVFMSANYLWIFLSLATLAIIVVSFAYLWKLPGLIGGVLDLLDTGIDAARDGAPTAHDDIRSLAYAFAALAGALTIFATIPFQLVKVWTNERQTRTAEENLTTDLINKAVEGLGAEKTLSRMGRALRYQYASDDFVATVQRLEWHDEPFAAERDDIIAEPEYGPWTAFEETKPNIEVRLGAIYALERIAQDSPRDHIRVMEILCAYLRENAPAREARRHDLGPWPELAVLPDQDDFAKHFEEVEKWTLRLKKWLEKLRADYPPRADIQAAITVIGRRSPAQIALEQAPKEDGTRTYRLDLRKVNLQAADLSELVLLHSQLDKARLEGATLSRAHLEGAFLVEAHLEGAVFSKARLKGAVLEGAHLEGASLFEPRLEGAALDRVHLEGARVSGAHLEGAFLDGVYLEGTYLSRANLEGAQFFGAQLSEQTSFNPVSLRGAGLKDVDLSALITDPDDLSRLLSEAFGDASVTLPVGLTAGAPPLDHWSTDTLDYDDFEPAWRAHQRAIGYVPPD